MLNFMSFLLLLYYPYLSLAISFNSQSCRMKCESLFGDSPTKLSLCLRTCSSTSIPQSSQANSNRANSPPPQGASKPQETTSQTQYANVYSYDRANNRYTRQKVMIHSSKTTSSSVRTINPNINNKFENISKCLKSCNGNLDKNEIRQNGEFTKWMKCRHSCFADSSPDQKSFELPFFDDIEKQETCDQECDRYWSGTVHWKPCKDQCHETDFKNDLSHSKDQNINGKSSIYDIW